jgi:hypothetical protein
MAMFDANGQYSQEWLAQEAANRAASGWSDGGYGRPPETPMAPEGAFTVGNAPAQTPNMQPQQFGGPQAPGGLGGAAGVAGPVNMGGGQPFAPKMEPHFAPPGGFGGDSGGQGNWMTGGNPYLSDQADNITRRMTDNYQRNVAPAQRQGMMQAGGFGNSRDAVIAANGMRDLNTGIGDALTGMYSQDWNLQQGRDLTKYQADQNYDVSKEGLRNNFYTAERTGDRADREQGASFMERGQNGQWGPINSANGVYSQYSGPNGAGSGNSGGTNWQQILGGAGAGAQFGRTMGWW